MPDLPQCKYSPFLKSKNIIGAAMQTGHARYCDLINPTHIDYSPEIARDYEKMSLQLMGMVPTIVSNPEEPKNNPGDKPGKPNNSGKPVDIEPPSRNTSVKILEDPEQHQRAYEAARDCPLRVETQLCCGGKGFKCGPNGTHPGQMTGMAICYPCSADRLGLKD